MLGKPILLLRSSLTISQILTMDWIEFLKSADVLAVAAVVSAIVQGLKKALNTNKVWTIVLAFGTAALASVVAYYAGYLHDVPVPVWFGLILATLKCGAIAIGWYEVVKNTIGKYFRPKG